MNKFYLQEEKDLHPMLLNCINKTLDEFDFKRVHTFMKDTNWKWGDTVPDIEELKNTARKLLISSTTTRTHELGGLVAEFVNVRENYDLTIPSTIKYTLRFQLTSISNNVLDVF